MLPWKRNKYYIFMCLCVHSIIRHAKRMRGIIKSSVAWLALQYSSILSHKWHDFPKKKVLNIKCIFLFSLQPLSETFRILRRIEQDIIINILRPSCKIPVIFCQILMRLEFSLQIFEKYSYIKFHENLFNGSTN